MNDHDEDRGKGGFMLKYENIEIKIENPFAHIAALRYYRG
jgi:hypothetical protein